MVTMGNGSTEDWKLESLRALYEETVGYVGMYERTKVINTAING